MNKKPITIIAYFLALCIAFIAVLWLNLSWRPDVNQLPPDSGFYAYFGKAILHGQLPYRDVWDDKPPLGYYLNALALLVFGQTPWGVWWSSVVWITGCLVLLFLVLRKLFANLAAILSSVIFLFALMSPQLFQGGNLMEVYALAPQIAVIGLAYIYFTRGRNHWLSLAAGGITAAAYMIKQPTIMLGGSLLLIMLVSALIERKFSRAFHLLLGFMAGFIGLLGLVSVYWLVNGAWGYFIDGAFLQGFSFIGGTGGNFIAHFLSALFRKLPQLFVGILFLISILGIGIFIIEKVLQTRANKSFQRLFSSQEWPWLVAVVALPLEVLMVSMGGKYYGHYFISMLPALITVIAYPIWKAVEASRKISPSRRVLGFNIASMVLLASTLLWGGVSLAQDWPVAANRADIVHIFNGQVTLNELEQYIVQTTAPTDTVLVWHIHLGFNFITDRYAPSRYLYPLNLFIPPSPGNTKLASFIDDIESHPPELIIVQKISSISLPFVNQPMDQMCNPWCTSEFTEAIQVPQIRQQWLRLQAYFDAHYTEDNQIYDWIIYRKLPSP